MPRSHLLFSSALVLLGVACASDSATRVDPLRIESVVFGQFSADPGATDIASPTAGTAAGTVRVTGTMRLPSACFGMSARVDPGNGFVMLQVVAEKQDGVCPAQVTAVSYDILVSGASPGPRTVSVRHTIEAGLAATTNDVALTSVIVN